MTRSPTNFADPYIRREIATLRHGCEVRLSSFVSLDHADALFQTAKSLRPKCALEVGMGHGASTLAILSGLAAGSGNLISIDPFQSADWHGAGLVAVESVGLSARHRLIEDFDYVALPELLAEGLRLQFAYIDGWHSFDYVMLDLFYIDKMLDVGGVVAFNDTGMAAVRRAIGFMKTHLRYAEIDVGLRRAYAASNAPKRLIRRALRWSTHDRYFKKLEDYTVPWNFYRRF
jgi:predicted O-methyltransferase YrrM